MSGLYKRAVLLLSVLAFSLFMSANGLAATPLTDCGSLSSGVEYVLVHNVNSSGTCFSVVGDNVILNGNGTVVNFSTAGMGGYGIYVESYNNFTVRNLTIVQGNASMSFKNTIDSGIYLANVSNSNITNVTVIIVNSTRDAFDAWHIAYPILIGGYNNSVTNNVIQVGGDNWVGILVTSSNNTKVAYNLVNSTTGNDMPFNLGIRSVASNFTNMTGNKVLMHGQRDTGIDVWMALNNFVRLNNVTSDGDHSYALRIVDAHNNTFLNNTLLATNISSTVVDIHDSVSNVIINNTVLSVGDYSYVIDMSYSNFTTISFNNITAVNDSSSVIYLYSSKLTILSNNTITATGSSFSYGVELWYSTNLNMSGNRMNITSGYAIYLGTLMMGSSGEASFYNHTIDTSNTEQGLPIYYRSFDSGAIIGDLTNIGELIIANATNTIVRNITGIVSDGLWIAGSANVTLTDSNITLGGGSRGGVLIDRSSGITMNNTNITGFGDGSGGMAAVQSVGCVFINNSIRMYGQPGMGMALILTNRSTIRNNTIIAYGNSSVGMEMLFESSSNTIANNNIVLNGYGSYGMLLEGFVSSNDVYGNEITMLDGIDFLVSLLGSGNAFHDMNFTKIRTILFADPDSVFSYSNSGSTGIYLNTAIHPAGGIINRTIASFNSTLLVWNDTNVSGAVSPDYSVTGLTASSVYYIYVTSDGTQTGPTSITTDGSGTSVSFTVDLNGNTEVMVQYHGPITTTPPSSGGGGGGGGGSYSVPQNIYLNDKFAVGSTYSSTAAAADTYLYYIGGQNHSIIVAEITADQAIVTIGPRQYNVTLPLGQRTVFDIDGNGKTDLAMTFLSVNGKYASLQFEEVKETPIEQPPKPEAHENVTTPAGNQTGTGTPGDNTAVYVIVIAAVIAGVLFMFFEMNAKKKAETKPWKNPNKQVRNRNPPPGP